MLEKTKEEWSEVERMLQLLHPAGKSDSLSPADKSPLDKYGQAGEEPSFSNDGVQNSDKDEALLGELGVETQEAPGSETQPTAISPTLPG